MSRLPEYRVRPLVLEVYPLSISHLIWFLALARILVQTGYTLICRCEVVAMASELVVLPDYS